MNDITRQHPLKVFYPPYSPAVNLNCTRFPPLHITKYCPFPGLLVEIINAVAKEASLKIIPMTDVNFGRSVYNNIALSEAQKLLLNDSIDIIALGFQKTEHREENFDFSNSLYLVKTRLLRRNYDGHMDQMFSFFNTYDSNVWLIFAVMWILQWIYCVFAQRIETNVEKRLSLVDSAWQLLRFQLLQPDKLPVQSTFGKFSIYVYSLLQCTILLGLFSSFILASIIKPPVEIQYPIRSMISSVMRGEFYLVTNDPNNWFYEKVNYSNDDDFIQLRRALAITPFKSVQNRDEALNLVASDNAYLFQQVDEWSFYQAMNRCDVIALEKYMVPVEAHLMLRKNHPLLDRLNKAILNLKIKLTGISWKYYEMAKQLNQCPPRNQRRPLQITPYAGLFLVCSIICGLASCAFIIELMIDHVRQRINQKLRLLITNGVN